MRMTAALLALGLIAAVEPPQPTYLDTLEVRITNLDVVVADRHGAPVRGLTRNDFEVRENGTLQPVTNFAEYTASSGLAQAGAPATATTTEERAADSLVSAPPPRKVLFFIDDIALHPITRKKLLNDALAFIDNTMQGGDEAMVVTPSTANKLSLTFTPDRRAVRARVEELLSKSTWRADSPYDLERFFYEKSVGGSVRPAERLEAKRMYAMRVVRRVNGTLRTLLGMVGSLADLPGRKVIVVISASITAQPGREAYTREDELESGVTNGDYDTSGREMFGESGNAKQGWKDLTPMIHEIGATAAATGITIYSLQPDMGVHVSPPGGYSETHRGTRAVGALALSQYQRDITEGTRTTLGTLADLTGGKFFQGGAQVDNAFRQLTNDVSSYYSLAYRAPQGTNDAFRKIDVVVKGRPDLVVRTRRELLRLSPGHAMDQLVASTLYVPRELNELGVAAVAQKPQRELDHYKVNIDVKIPLEKLTFIPVGNVYRATFSLHYAAADGNDYATGATRQQSVQVAPAELDAVRQKTYTYTTTLVISPGTAKIAVGVLDELSRLSSLQRLTVEAR
jgi:VWFA-related protein